MTFFLLTVKILITGILLVLASLSIVLFFQFKWPSLAFWWLKVFASALSKVFLSFGIFSILTGLATGAYYIILLGVFVACVYLFHFILVTRSPSVDSGFERAFGRQWANHIKLDQKKYYLSSRRLLKLPNVPDPQIEQDIPFALIPGTNQELLCDIWQPHAAIRKSGLAYVYMHGGAFYVLDKNWATRSLFSHLTAQGHVVMDIAYRMAPECGLSDMIMDVKRALAWMKENAKNYGIDPDRIILAGSSSGGYLALMASYTGGTDFVPDELRGRDLSCLGVVTESPTADLMAMYYHTNQQNTDHNKSAQIKKKDYQKFLSWLGRRFSKEYHRLRFDKGYSSIGDLTYLMGGSPEECPENFKKYSPATYIHLGCPPTLLIHGNHDCLAPLQATLALYDQLEKARVPVVMHIIAQTDHAFSRFLPDISPAAINVIYDIERFIAIAAARNGVTPL